MIQSIGFKNFRRFENFPDMELGKVNLFVGPNNSGKSTLAKGLILLLDNLKNLEYTSTEKEAPRALFEFDANQLHSLHISTFKNAIYAGTKNNMITFNMKIDDFCIELDVLGDRSSSSINGDVTRLKVSSKKYGTEITLNFIEFTMSVTFTSLNANKDEISELKNNLSTVVKSLSGLKRALSRTTDPIHVSSLNQQISKLEEQRKFIKTNINKLNHGSLVDADITDTIPILFSDLNHNVFDLIVETAHSSSRSIGAYRKKENKSIFDSVIIGENYETIRRFINDLKKSIDSIKIEYVFAHGVSQKQVLNSNDKSDYLAQTIHEYYKLRVQEGDELQREIKDSLNKYKLGDNFRIISLEGEGYIVEIHDEFGWSNLANKGMGTIQLFTLSLRLNMIEFAKRNDKIVYVFIEEPEQNLHPEFQSMLAEKFKELSEKDIYCVVETHSEYIIRNTQVLVSKAKYADAKDLNENNPFNVVYFDPRNGDEPYYKLVYRTNGRFENDFGPGFLDEASKLTYELF